MVWFEDTCEGLPVTWRAGTDSNGDSDKIDVFRAASVPLSFERYFLTGERGAAASSVYVR